jgi:synaptobrevin family protein YKT6
MTSEMMCFLSRTIVERIDNSSSTTIQRISVRLKDDLMIAHVVANYNRNLLAVLFAHPDYPVRVAFSMLTQLTNLTNISDDVKEKELGEWLARYERPEDGDALIKTQKVLDDVKDIMVQNVEQVLRRGEKIGDLIEKSKDLSSTSQLFYKKARATNSCCAAF